MLHVGKRRKGGVSSVGRGVFAVGQGVLATRCVIRAVGGGKSMFRRVLRALWRVGRALGVRVMSNACGTLASRRRMSGGPGVVFYI